MSDLVSPGRAGALSLVTVLVVAGLAPTTSAAAQAIPTGPDSDSVPVVTGEAPGAPAGCDADAVGARLAALYRDLSEGKEGLVEEYFGSERGAPFQWYSHTGPGGAPDDHYVTYDLESLPAHFAERRRQNERIRLGRIKVNRWDGGRGVVHFGPVQLTRMADDLPEPESGDRHLVTGKGAYHCSTRAFVVISIAVMRVRGGEAGPAAPRAPLPTEPGEAWGGRHGG